MAMKLYFTLEIGDESQNQTWILTSSVILVQLKKLLEVLFVSDVWVMYQTYQMYQVYWKQLWTPWWP